MPDNYISGIDSYVKLGALPYSFKNWNFPVDGGVKKFFAFGSNFQRTLPGGISAEITMKGAYNQGNMPLVVGNVYEVHLGFAAGIEIVVNARLANVSFESEISAGGEPGGQCSCTFASEGAFAVSFS